MTTKELLAQLNALRTANGKTELASWKSGMPKLVAAIEAEGGTVEQPTAEDPHAASNELIANAIANDPELAAMAKADEPAASDLSDVEGRTEEAPEDAPAEPLIPRGAIGAMSIELLTASDEPYESIVGKIVARYPTAKTTARSLASVAMDLRRDGVEVPSRRKPAKAKEAKQEAPAGE